MSKLRELSRNYMLDLKEGKKQSEDIQNGFVVKDDIEYVHDNQVPLWMFGFLY